MEKPMFNLGDIVPVNEDEWRNGKWKIISHPFRMTGSDRWWYQLCRPDIPSYQGTVITISEERLIPDADYLRRKFEEVSQELLAMKKQMSREREKLINITTDRIPVPENIKFYSYVFLTGKAKGLVSPNGKVGLHEYGGCPTIGKIDLEIDQFCYIIPNKKTYLTPCKRSDLKPGDIAYRTGSDLVLDYSELKYYGVVLNDREHAFWTDKMDMRVDLAADWMNWYKVTFEE